MKKEISFSTFANLTKNIECADSLWRYQNIGGFILFSGGIKNCLIFSRIKLAKNSLGSFNVHKKEVAELSNILVKSNQKILIESLKEKASQI